MTDPQIRYRQLVETKRHNLATEGLTAQQISTQSETSKYVAGVQAAASRYSADKHYQGTVYASDQSAAVSRYATVVNADTAMQRSMLEHDDRMQRLAFDRATQLVLNSIKQKELDLQTLRTVADNEVSRAQARKLIQDMENSVQQLALNAKSVGITEERAKYQNALDLMRTVKTGEETLSGLLKLGGDIAGLLALGSS